MKTFSKMTLLAAGLAVAALPLLAADANKRADRAKERGDRPALRALARQQAVRKHVVRKLDLTDEQKSQLKAVRGETRQAVKALRGDSSLTTDQKKSKARELRQTTRGKVRVALTDEQKKKAGKMRHRLRALRDKDL